MIQGHVVHLLEQWGDGTPPADLRTAGAMKALTRAVLAVLLVVASIVTVVLVWVLWTNETPGWWFSLLFTLFLVGMAVALWAVCAAAIRTGRERAVARTRWSESLGRVRYTPGTIVARDVSTIEDGTVSAFELTVDAGDRLTAEWRPRFVKPLLQTQVPGVGAAVRVWRSPDAPADHPLVVEALDPSVVHG